MLSNPLAYGVCTLWKAKGKFPWVSRGLRWGKTHTVWKGLFIAVAIFNFEGTRWLGGREGHNAKRIKMARANSFNSFIPKNAYAAYHYATRDNPNLICRAHSFEYYLNCAQKLFDIWRHSRRHFGKHLMTLCFAFFSYSGCLYVSMTRYLYDASPQQSPLDNFFVFMYSIQ